ncbi:MAG: DUF2851 family protein [Bacteroidales bacterium]|nr:DUF2851 family protein [Bacteroidales bacterium]
MEKLLHYVWKHRIYPLGPLMTTKGQRVEIIDPGLQNFHAGPDFFNAKVRIDGTLWIGNVEIHLRSSDWQHHGHINDAAYNNVILHVAESIDGEVFTADGRCLPQLQLPIPESVHERYVELLQTDDYPRCWRILSQLSPLTVHAWMSALLCERLQTRADRCLERLTATNGDWNRTWFITLARNFGFGVNGDAFERWARHFPLQAAAKHRDDAFQLEALFLGTAGLLELDNLPSSSQKVATSDAYYLRLVGEWNYLSHKFQLKGTMPAANWRYLRLRPQNFPHLRLVQLAQLYHLGQATPDKLLHATQRKFLQQALDVGVTDYWQSHYLFGLETPCSDKRLSEASRDLIIINTICPMLFAYGQAHSDENFQERALNLLEQLKPERNFILRQWQQCGVGVENAADSQALIQLKQEYCDRHDCLRCRFGYEYLKF